MSGDTVEELPCKFSTVEYADLCAPAAWPPGDSNLRREALYCTVQHTMAAQRSMVSSQAWRGLRSRSERWRYFTRFKGRVGGIDQLCAKGLMGGIDESCVKLSSFGANTDPDPTRDAYCNIMSWRAIDACCDACCIASIFRSRVLNSVAGHTRSFLIKHDMLLVA